MSLEILNVVAPILLIAGIGYVLEWRGMGFHSASLSRLVILLGTPSLVFSALTETTLPAQDVMRLMLGALLVVLIGGTLATIALILARLPVRSFIASLSLPNSGNVGLPVVLFAFGDEGLTIGVAFFFTIALCQYLIAPLIMAGQFRIRSVIEQPLVWSIVAVVGFKSSGIAPPQILSETTKLLGGMMVPVMLVLLGGALARLKVKDVKVSTALAVVRLLIGTASGFAVITILPLEPIEAAAIFLMSSMPAALVTYVFAERYGRSPEQVAGLVVSSTILTFALLPVLVSIALYIAGR